MPKMNSIFTRNRTKNLGRVQDRGLSALLRVKLDEIDEETGQMKGQIVCEKLVQMAIAGNIEAMQLIWNRVEGKIAETQEEPTQMLIEVAYVTREIQSSASSIRLLPVSLTEPG